MIKRQTGAERQLRWIDRWTRIAMNVYIRPIPVPWTPPSRGTAQPSSPTNNNLECFASPACMFNGFFPAQLSSVGELGTRHTFTYPPISIGLETEKILFSAAYPVTLSRPPPGFLGGFLLWMRGVVRTIQVRMYATKQNPSRKCLAGRPQSRSRLHLSPKPALLSSFYLFFPFLSSFSDLPRARSRSHLTPKGEYIRYCYLLRDNERARNTCMYGKKKSGSSEFPLSTGRYRSSIRSGTL